MTIELSSTKKFANYRLDDQVVVSGDIDAAVYTAGNGIIIDDTNKISINKNDVVNREDAGCQAIGANSRSLGEHSISYTDNSIAEGEFCAAGTNSFRVVSGDANLYTWTLKTTKGIRPGYTYSIRLNNNYDMVGDVLSVLDDTTISVDKMPFDLRPMIRKDENLSDDYLSSKANYYPDGHVLSAHRSESTTDYSSNADNNSLWIFRHPELGDLSSYATAAIAQGFNCQAGRQYSHAEGLGTTTIGKYAHSEGYETIAVWAAHSEGYQTSAYGQCSHAEGTHTLTRGTASHAEGTHSYAMDTYSFVFNGNEKQNYSSHGQGSFNINPNLGKYGFFVGEQSLGDILDEMDDTLLNDVEEALSSGCELRDVDFNIVSGYHINSKDNEPTYGQPIHTDTSAYFGEYATVKVKPSEQYEIDTRLGDNMCICISDKMLNPLKIIKDAYKFKHFTVDIPDDAKFMFVDNYTKIKPDGSPVDVHYDITIQKMHTTYYDVSSIDKRLAKLEQTFDEIEKLTDEILA